MSPPLSPPGSSPSSPPSSPRAKNRIILPQGRSNYDSVSTMTDGFADAFARRGFRCDVVHMLAPNDQRTLGRLLAGDDIALFFSLNGILLPRQGASFYAQTDAPVFAWFVDHPLHHVDRILAQVPRLCLGFFAPWQVEFCHAAIDPALAVAEIAHAAAPGHPLAWEERDIAVLFSGMAPTDTAAARAAWRDLGAEEERRLNDMLDLHEADTRRPLERIVCQVLDRPMDDHRPIGPYFERLDRHLRDRLREGALTALAGLPVTVIGPGWKESGLAPPGFRLLGEMAVEETFGLMARAKLTLNPMPAYYGSHERVFQAMANGSAAASVEGPLWDAWFPGGEMIVLPEDTRAHADLVAAALADDTALAATAARGQAAFAAAHTWDHRVDAVLAFLDQQGLGVTP